MSLQTWALSTLKACLRQADNKTHEFTNQDLVKYELGGIVSATHSVGKTPKNTMARTLQELRDQGLVRFVTPGVYRLQQVKIKIEDLFKTKMSKGEKLIANLLRDLGIPFEQEKKYADLKSRGFLRFDFVFEVQGRKFAVEFQGQQHYRPVDFFGGQAAFEDLQKRDRIKREYCHQEDIQLIYIDSLDPAKALRQVSTAILQGLTMPRLRPQERKTYGK
jgi:hypothetical protein